MAAMANRRRWTQAGLLLAALTTAVFGRVASHGFVCFDDNFYVTENPFVRGGLGLDGLRWAFFTDNGNYWHPLAIVSHMLDVQLFGLDPAGHHAVSVLLHLAAVLVLFLTLERMTGDFWPSAFTAAVFAVHPVQVESVAWIAERKTLLAALAMLTSLWLYARHAERPSRGRLAAAAAVFALSLMAKPSTVAFPILLLLVDRWPLRRGLTWSASLREKAAFIVLAAASCVATRLSARFVTGVPLGDRLLNSPVFYLRYLGETLWPSGLSVFHPYPAAPRPWAGLAAAALLAGITAVVIRLRRRNPALMTGWLWFAASIAPMAGLVAVGAHSIADRFLYLPLIGLAIMAAWGLPAAFPRPKAWVAAGAAVVGALSLAASAQVSHWRDSIALFERAAAVEPGSALVQTHLGFAYFERGDLPAAIARFRRALELAPADFAARNYLGIALASQGDVRGAIRELTLAEAVAPDPALVSGNIEALKAALAAGVRPAVRSAR